MAMDTRDKDTSKGRKGKGTNRGRRKAPATVTTSSAAPALRVVGGQDVDPAAPAPLPRLRAGKARNVDGLTSKMEAFAQGLAAGKTQADAWRGAYDASNMLPESIWQAASHLAKDPRVVARVNALVKAQEAVALHDAAQVRKLVLQRLHEEANDARTPPAVRVRALELLGKSAALFVDRVENTNVTADAGADAVEAALEARLSRLLAAG